MLIAQAERQIEWWTGSAPPPGVVGAAAERTLDAEALRSSR
jgi:hypothetical protein